MSKPYELQGIPRMHIHKIREVEEMVWYRENSLRFMKLSKPKAVISIITGVLILPYVFQNWLIWNNEQRATTNDEVLCECERNIMTRAFYPPDKDSMRDGQPYQAWCLNRAGPEYKHDGANGGWPADYRGPEEMIRYQAMLAEKYQYPGRM